MSRRPFVSQIDGFEEQPFLTREEEAANRRVFSSQNGKTRTSFNTSPILIAAIIISAIVSSLATLAFTSHGNSNQAVVSKPHSGSDLLSNLPNLKVPILGPIREEFRDDPVYLDRSTHEAYVKSEKAWKGLIPNGRGFVSTAKLLADGILPKSLLDMDTENAGQYAISSFHQLHCLHMIVNSYTKALKDEPHDINHTKHCLEYLRSSIICAADSALEPWKSDLNGVDGFGSAHMCRDFDALFEWAERYRHVDT